MKTPSFQFQLRVSAGRLPAPRTAQFLKTLQAAPHQLAPKPGQLTFCLRPCLKSAPPPKATWPTMANVQDFGSRLPEPPRVTACNEARTRNGQSMRIGLRIVSAIVYPSARSSVKQIMKRHWTSKNRLTSWKDSYNSLILNTISKFFASAIESHAGLTSKRFSKRKHG